MRSIIDIELFTDRLADKIERDYRHGYNQGRSTQWTGIYQRRLEGLRWVLEQIDFDDKDRVVERVTAAFVNGRRVDAGRISALLYNNDDKQNGDADYDG
jgi:hypothetical protein